MRQKRCRCRAKNLWKVSLAFCWKTLEGREQRRQFIQFLASVKLLESQFDRIFDHATVAMCQDCVLGWVTAQ